MDNFFLEHLKGVTLTKSQERIAQYMLENQYTVCQKSLIEVSREVGVSDASVLRFTRAIGFDGYNDFKTALYNHLAAQASVNASHGTMDLDSRLRSNHLRGGDCFQDFLKASLDNVERSLAQTSAAAYSGVVSQLRRRRNIFVFGSRAARSSADHFATGLRYIKDNVIYIQHASDLYAALRGADSGDMLLFLCISRFYKEDVGICEAARAAGVWLCLLTNTAPSPVTKYADSILLVQTDCVSYFNSTIGIAAVCEYLLTLLAQETEGTAQRLAEIDACSAEERCPRTHIE